MAAFAGCSLHVNVPHDAPAAVSASVSPTRIVVEAEPAETAPAPPSEPAPILDPWEMAQNEDYATCRDELKAAGYEFQALPERTARDKDGCGIPHPIVLSRGPTGIAYDPPVLVDCSLARALGKVEAIVQEEAESNLHAKIVRVGNAGAFACRPRNFRKGASLSAHAFGSAVDVTSFAPAKGAVAVIDRDYDERVHYAPGQEARRAFLHRVYSRLRAHEADLTYVVGPDFNAPHHNHFHLDRGGWAFWSNR